MNSHDGSCPVIVNCSDHLWSNFSFHTVCQQLCRVCFRFKNVWDELIYIQEIQTFLVVVFGSGCYSLVQLWGSFVMFRCPEILCKCAVFTCSSPSPTSFTERCVEKRGNLLSFLSDTNFIIFIFSNKSYTYYSTQLLFLKCCYMYYLRLISICSCLLHTPPRFLFSFQIFQIGKKMCCLWADDLISLYAFLFVFPHDLLLETMRNSKYRCCFPVLTKPWLLTSQTWGDVSLVTRWWKQSYSQIKILWDIIKKRKLWSFCFLLRTAGNLKKTVAKEEEIKMIKQKRLLLQLSMNWGYCIVVIKSKS